MARERQGRAGARAVLVSKEPVDTFNSLLLGKNKGGLLLQRSAASAHELLP